MTVLVKEAPGGASIGGPQLGYRTLLLHVQSGEGGTARLRTAAALARKLDATLFGLAAEMVPPLTMADPTGLAAPAGWYLDLDAVIRSNLAAARETFAAESLGLKTEWAWIEDMPTLAVARASRGADLIVAGGAPTGGQNKFRDCNPAELVLTSGRPVLVAPPLGGMLHANAVVVAWKDTREARRALADALPFLVQAERVLVLEVCGEGESQDAEARTAFVVQGLRRHGVKAQPRIVIAPPERVAIELNIAAEAIGADLIVAGGYGHTRLGEWMFGGVTRDLLHWPERFVMLSH